MEILKRKIAIVCGGDSSEYEVSLRSAQGLYSFFDKNRYDVYIVDMKGQDWHVELDNYETARIDKNDFSFKVNGKTVWFDYAYITIHGTPGENGYLQGYFELIGLPYSTSNVLIEALTFDKYILNNYLKGYGVNVAPSILVRRGEEDTLDQLAPALRRAFMENNEVMIEGFMEGTEITCGIYKTSTKTVVLPITEVVTSNEFFDYDAKYNGQVQEITPARIPEDTARRVAEETSRIYDILHANGIIRIDYIITRQPDGTDKIMMLEINTTPGMTPTSFSYHNR